MMSRHPQSREQDLKPKISVVGVGGAGGNAVNNMINAKLEGVEFIVCNTDAQALNHAGTERRIQLGLNITQGLGAGSKPEIGAAAAEESIQEMLAEIHGSHMLFITAGMGGGTGTGAAPVIARAAREQGILTVGVVTKPFHFEGAKRMRLAEQGIEELQQYVDTLIIIPNQNLFRVANESTTFADAFKMADNVLYSGVRGVTDLMIMPGLINLDFADVRSVMSEMGKAMMGTGEAEGENRAIEAAEAAISNPLLEDVTMRGAQGVLINITGGLDMTLFEVDEAANRIRDEIESEANIIFGSTFDPTLNGRMRVSVVATGIDAALAGGKYTLAPRRQADLVSEKEVVAPEPMPELDMEEEVVMISPRAPSMLSPVASYDEAYAAYDERGPMEGAPQAAPQPAPLPFDVHPSYAEHAPHPHHTSAPDMRGGDMRSAAPQRDAHAEPAGRKPSFFQRLMGRGQEQHEPAHQPARSREGYAPNYGGPAAPDAGHYTPEAYGPAEPTVHLESVTSHLKDQNLDIPAFLRRKREQ